MIIEQNAKRTYRSRARRLQSTWRKHHTAPLYCRAVPSSKGTPSVPEKGPTFLKVYVIPALLLNVVLASWDIASPHITNGGMIDLGYAVIVSIGLYLYLAYLDHYLSEIVSPLQNREN